MSKSADAFRTISEVADWLDTPAHVLRFWESKFSQVKPVKRAGGRRYYRPADMRLLGGIKKLLHEDGMTIKGAQKILREKGIRHVASLCTLSVGDEEDIDDAVLQDVPASEPVATVVPFSKPVEPVTSDRAVEQAELVPKAEEDAPVAKETVAEPEVTALDAVPEEDAVAGSEVDETEGANAEIEPSVLPPEPDEPAVKDVVQADISEDAAAPEPLAEAETASLPEFLQRSMEDRIDSEIPDIRDKVAEPEPAEAVVDVAPPAPVDPSPGALTWLASIKRLTPESAKQIEPLVEKLRERVR